MRKTSKEKLKAKADKIRKALVKTACSCEAGHIASSLSTVDVLTVLYYSQMKLSRDPKWEGRDRFILSKAHGCYAYYTILSDLGIMKVKDWGRLYKRGKLTGCVERHPEHGIESSGGALGHGLPMAAGLALAFKHSRKNNRVYCMVGDGELQEGSNWEAIQFAAAHGLSNLTVIIDNNGLQAMDFTEKIMGPFSDSKNLKKKFESFGFSAVICDGHDIGSVLSAFKIKGPQPKVVIAETVKGKDLICMENVPKFHFRMPNEQEIKQGWRKS